MITLLISGSRVPDGTVVRKPTGTKTYYLKHRIDVYEHNRQTITFGDGVVCLVADGTINVQGDEKQVAVDFVDMRELHEWMQVHFLDEDK